jgi:anti-anti-sigma factor
VPEGESKLAIEERQVGDVIVLSLNKGQHKILADLAGVTYIDSAGVGMLAFEYKAVHAKGGALKLLGLSGHSHRTFALMKLMTVFEVFEDESMAIRSFART